MDECMEFPSETLKFSFEKVSSTWLRAPGTEECWMMLPPFVSLMNIFFCALHCMMIHQKESTSPAAALGGMAASAVAVVAAIGFALIF